MKLLTLKITALLLSVCMVSFAQENKGQYSADVIIYGGTCAAVTAAVQVVKQGKTVLVVSPDKHLGGLSAGGLGFTDTGNKSVIGGLAREFYHRVYLHYDKPEAWEKGRVWKQRTGNTGHGWCGSYHVDIRTQSCRKSIRGFCERK
jgi:ribulose 1,5-bisphosphate synthetase/thiazole synthase